MAVLVPESGGNGYTREDFDLPKPTETQSSGGQHNEEASSPPATAKETRPRVPLSSPHAEADALATRSAGWGREELLDKHDGDGSPTQAPAGTPTSGPQRTSTPTQVPPPEPTPWPTSTPEPLDATVEIPTVVPDTPVPVPTPAQAGDSRVEAALAHLARIRECESGNQYHIADYATGRTYFGAYQFSPRTWNWIVAVAGYPEYVGVLPSAAPPHVQDAAALSLYLTSGPQHWPHCQYS